MGGLPGETHGRDGGRLLLLQGDRPIDGGAKKRVRGRNSSGLSRVPGEGFCAHSTAKSGLDAFLKSLAFELGPKGIRVNIVAPGLTRTDATAWLSRKELDASAQMTPLKRIGLPEDVAGAVLFLASEEARFISGVYLPVSGGIHMS